MPRALIKWNKHKNLQLQSHEIYIINIHVILHSFSATQDHTGSIS